MRVKSETGTEEEAWKKRGSPHVEAASQHPTQPHSPGLAIGLLPARASPLASASSKVKMATGLWPLVSQWPPAGEACAGALAPRGGRRRRWRENENDRRMKEEGHEDETLLECGTEVKPMTR